MMNLDDIFSNAHGGEAIQTLAKQFKLTTDQAQAAVDAVLPALSLGLQQQMQSAEAFTGLMSTIASGAQADAFDNPAVATSKAMINSGNEFLTQIFGATPGASKEAQAQIAQYAADMSGVGANVIQKMLPMIATMILGGLFKAAMKNGLGDLLGQIAGQAMGQKGKAGQNPMGDLLEGILGQMIGGGKKADAPAEGKKQKSAGAKKPPADPVVQGLDILKGMFETGQKAQKQQMQGLENIFDQILKSQKR